MENINKNANEFFRAFFAIELSESVRKKVCSVMDELKKELKSPAIKWVKKQNLHITLNFLGNISQEKSGLILKNLIKKMQQQTVFSAKFSSFVTLPLKKFPRVLALSIQPEEPIAELAEIIKETVSDSGIAVEKRKFYPHLTIARIKDKIRFDIDLKEILIPEIKFDVSNVTLFRSDTAPKGSIYSVLASIRLKRAP